MTTVPTTQPAMAVFLDFELINNGGRQDQHASDQEVGKIADESSRCTLDHELDQLLDKFHEDTRDRAKGKSGRSWQGARRSPVCKTRCDHGDREIEAVENTRTSREHTDHDDLTCRKDPFPCRRCGHVLHVQTGRPPGPDPQLPPGIRLQIRHFLLPHPSIRFP